MNSFKFYIRDDTPVETTEAVQETLVRIERIHQSTHQIVFIKDLNDTKREQLLEIIRIISRKNGMGVISKGREPLPISRNRNLSKVGILSTA